ncbi:hypothetical protein NLI96_g9933 [Meripilus lineatus]|uniref:Uncharacterized protein n=1 Tax=Meripilus lineatus TaxID=2056292 RepID=A0AAD5YES4_9APHY|nr:hypothetical protein NLI96_g9933 [Physisporinus lineatus]
MAGYTSTPSRVVSQPMKSRAHYCFQHPDITALIVQEMTEGSSQITRSSQKNLAVFARICHSTVDCALRALWRQQDGLDNLIRTLPADLWAKAWMGRVESEESDDVEEYDRDVDDLDETVNQVHLIGKKREVYSLKKPLTSFEWQRFEYYAAFIKQLCLGYQGSGVRSMEWSPDVSSALQFHRLFLEEPLFLGLVSPSYAEAYIGPYSFQDAVDPNLLVLLPGHVTQIGAHGDIQTSWCFRVCRHTPFIGLCSPSLPEDLQSESLGRGICAPSGATS